jgi:hypothetical protein
MLRNSTNSVPLSLQSSEVLLPVIFAGTMRSLGLNPVSIMRCACKRRHYDSGMQGDVALRMIGGCPKLPLIPTVSVSALGSRHSGLREVLAGSTPHP